MRPQLPEYLRKILRVFAQLNKEHSCQEEQVKTGFRIFRLNIFYLLNHFVPELSKQVLELLLLAAENQERDSLDCVTLFERVCRRIIIQKTSLVDLPFGLLVVEDLVRLPINIDKSFDDNLPLPEG